MTASWLTAGVPPKAAAICGASGHPTASTASADRGGEPQAVDALPDRRIPMARPELTGDGGRRAVGQEDRDADQRRERLAGDAQAAERHGAEAPDDGGVGEQEERLGDERAESRQRQPQDLRILRVGLRQPRPALAGRTPRPRTARVRSARRRCPRRDAAARRAGWPRSGRTAAPGPAASRRSTSTKASRDRACGCAGASARLSTGDTQASVPANTCSHSARLRPANVAANRCRSSGQPSRSC